MPSLASAFASVPGVIIIGAGMPSGSARRSASLMSVTIGASAGHSMGGTASTGSTLHLVPGDVAQLVDERRLVGARQRPNVDLRLPAAGDHVHLLPDADHRRGDRVAQHGVDRAAQDRVGDAPIEGGLHGGFVASRCRLGHRSRPRAARNSRTTPMSRAGWCSAARRLTAAASLTVGLSACGMLPWPGRAGGASAASR